jgi:hypothetical protein
MPLIGSTDKNHFKVGHVCSSLCGAAMLRMNEEQTKDRVLEVGDRIVFTDLGKERAGIVRGFQWADWADEPLVMVDIDPPLPGSPALSNGRRIERHRVVRMGRI